MKWHKLNARGEIVTTVDAPDKATALATLGGGTIVSALSYQAAPIVKPPPRHIAKRSKDPALPPGYLWTRHAAGKVGVSVQRFLEITRRLDLTPGRATRIGGARLMFYWSPDDIHLVTDYHRSRFSPARLEAAKAKRRTSLLYHHARRWGWIPADAQPDPTTTPEP